MEEYKIHSAYSLASVLMQRDNRTYYPTSRYSTIYQLYKMTSSGVLERIHEYKELADNDILGGRVSDFAVPLPSTNDLTSFIKNNFQHLDLAHQSVSIVTQTKRSIVSNANYFAVTRVTVFMLLQDGNLYVLETAYFAHTPNDSNPNLLQAISLGLELEAYNSFPFNTGKPQGKHAYINNRVLAGDAIMGSVSVQSPTELHFTALYPLSGCSFVTTKGAKTKQNGKSNSPFDFAQTLIAKVLQEVKPNVVKSYLPNESITFIIVRKKGSIGVGRGYYVSLFIPSEGFVYVSQVIREAELV